MGLADNQFIPHCSDWLPARIGLEMPMYILLTISVTPDALHALTLAGVCAAATAERDGHLSTVNHPFRRAATLREAG